MLKRLAFPATLALFALLGIFAWKSGGAIYETGPRLDIVEGEGAVIFRWEHEIEAPMARRFADAFADWKGRADRIVIDLNSPGGSITEGRLVIDEIARMKKTHAVETHVGPRAFCLSMCVPVYLQGERRTAAPAAVFMFHEPATYDFVTEERIDKPRFEQRMDAARFFERYFVGSDMNPVWRDALREEWKGKDLWFTAEELVGEGANVVEEIEG